MDSTPPAPGIDGTSTLDPTSFAGVLGRELGVREVRSGSWFTKLVTLYLRFQRGRVLVDDGRPPVERARRAILRASVRSALTGAAAAATATGATVLTVQTHGIAGIAALPTAAAGIFGEMLYRALIHVELTCDIARIYGVELDADDPADLMHLYALAFGFESSPGGALGEARSLIDNVLRVSGQDVGQSIGSRLLGDSLKRNAVPFMGIVTSASGNYQLTRSLGDTVHRYVRFSTALQVALVSRISACGEHAELLTEGVWFMLTADGRLGPEETALLGWLLRQQDPASRARVTKRFVEDEADFLRRLGETPQSVRETLLHAFEVASAVDGMPSLPERRVLRNAARALGSDYDPERVSRVARELADLGSQHHARPAPTSGRTRR